MPAPRYVAPPKDSKVRDPVQAIMPELRAFLRSYRNPACDRCELSKNHPTRCLPGIGPTDPGTPMVVYEQPSYWDIEHKRPLLGQVGAYFGKVLDEAGLDRFDLYLTNAIKCKAAGKGEVISAKALAEARHQCSTYLNAEIAGIEPRLILSMGASAYYYFTHKPNGVFKARGDAEERLELPGSPTVIYTVSPSAVLRNPALHAAFVSDVKKFGRYVRGENDPPKVETVLIRTPAEFNAAVAELWEDKGKGPLTFDLETRGFVAHKPDYSKVWCAAFSRGVDNGNGMRSFLLPIEHLDSPFLQADERCHPAVVREVLKLVFRNRVNGHNLMFDLLHSHYLARRYDLDIRELPQGAEPIPEDADAWTLEHPRPIPEPAAPKPRKQRVAGGKAGRTGKASGSAASGKAATGDAGTQLSLDLAPQADGGVAGKVGPDAGRLCGDGGLQAGAPSEPGATEAHGDVDGAAGRAGRPGQPAPEPEGPGEPGGHGGEDGSGDPERDRGEGAGTAG